MKAPVRASRAPAVAVRGMMVSAMASNMANRVGPAVVVSGSKEQLSNKTVGATSVPPMASAMRCTICLRVKSLFSMVSALEVAFFQFAYGVVRSTCSHGHVS